MKRLEKLRFVIDGRWFRKSVSPFCAVGAHVSNDVLTFIEMIHGDGCIIEIFQMKTCNLASDCGAAGFLNTEPLVNHRGPVTDISRVFYAETIDALSRLFRKERFPVHLRVAGRGVARTSEFRAAASPSEVARDSPHSGLNCRSVVRMDQS